MSHHDQSNRVLSLTKTKFENDMTSRIRVAYAENKTELS